MEVLWRRLAAESAQAVAERAAVALEADAGAFIIPLCGQRLRVLPAARRIECPDGPCGFEATLLGLNYLLGAKDDPPAGELVNPRTLPLGDFFFRGPHDLPTGMLEAAFGLRLSAFRRAAEAIGGRALAAGDAAYEFQALPRVPVTVILWTADEEFPARVQFLLDQKADRQLPLDSLWLLCLVLAKRLAAIGGKG